MGWLSGWSKRIKITTDYTKLGPNVETFLASGMWTCPAGVTEIQIECWGAGGGGGGCFTTDAKGAGGGGAGGAYSKKNSYAVIPTNNYNFFVGAKGSVGASVDGGNGGDSYWVIQDASSCSAKGGGGGKVGTNTAQGAGGIGGALADGFGDTKYSGGNGFGGGAINGVGGGGGEGAATNANGNSATNQSGGTGTNGGDGGAGGANHVAGSPATNGSGGGGGGAGHRSGTNLAGGLGTIGKITITYVGVPHVWFPVTVHLKDANGGSTKVFQEVGNNSRKIAVTESDGETELKGEIHKWSYDAETPSNSTGVIDVSRDGWIISDTVNTDFYLYFDNDHADNPNVNVTDTAAAEQVWDNNHKGVWHKAGTGETAIDVGNACIDRATMLAGDVTYIDLANPVDFTGRLTNVAIYAAVSMASAKVAVFYSTGGNNYTARSVSGNLGAVTSGAVRNFSVDLPVVAGDFIGIYFLWSDDAIEYSIDVGTGIRYLAGDQTACIDATFGLWSGAAISLYGTGITINIKDSTSNNNDGFKKGVNEPLEIAGKVGQAQDYDGIDDYVTTPFTWADSGMIEMTIRVDAFPGTNTQDYLWRIFGTTDDGAFIRLNTDASNIKTLEFWYYDRSATKWYTCTIRVDAGGLNWSTGEWHHIVARWSINEDNLILCCDGAVVTIDGTFTIIPAMTDNIQNIGSDQAGASTFNGVIDELKYHVAARSTAWVKGSYNSLWDTLLTYGDEETEGVLYGYFMTDGEKEELFDYLMNLILTEGYYMNPKL